MCIYIHCAVKRRCVQARFSLPEFRLSSVARDVPSSLSRHRRVERGRVESSLANEVATKNRTNQDSIIWKRVRGVDAGHFQVSALA